MLVGIHLSGKGCLHGDVEVGDPQYVGIGIVMTVEQGEHHAHHVSGTGSAIDKRNDRLLTRRIPIRSAQGFELAIVVLRFQVNGVHRYREVDEETVAQLFLYHGRKLFHQQFLYTLQQSLQAGGGVYADDDRTEAARRRETQSTRRLADVCIAYLTVGYRLIVHPLSLKKHEVFRVSRAGMLQLYLPVEIHRLGCTVWHCPTTPAYMEDCFPVTCGKIQKT